MKKLFITMSLMAFLGGFTMNSYAQEGEKKSETTKTTKKSKKSKSADGKTKSCAEKACCKKGDSSKKTATPKATK